MVTITATESPTSSQNNLYHEGDVGHLLVKVIEADGLQTKSLGKRQPFVMLELVNQFVKTRRKEGTASIVWEKEFNLYVSFCKPSVLTFVFQPCDRYTH